MLLSFKQFHKRMIKEKEKNCNIYHASGGQGGFFGKTAPLDPPKNFCL